MDSKYVGMICGVVVAVLLIVTLAIPVISESVQTEDKFTNTGIYTLDKLSSDSTYSLSWDHTDPSKVTIGTDTVDMTPFGYSIVMLIGSENFALRYFAIQGGATGIQIYGDDQNFSAATSNNKDMNVTIASGTMTANNGIEKTYDIGSNAYAYNTEGKGSYVLKDSSVDSYVLDETTVTIIQLSKIQGSDSCGIFGIGTIKDGFEFSDFYGTATYPLTFGTETISSVADSDHVDLSKISSVTVPATQNGTTVNLVCNSFIVPAEITAERSIHVTDTESTLLSVIPLLLVVGVILGVITMFISRRN